MKKKELYELINEVTENHSKRCSEFDEKTNLLALEHVLQNEHIHINEVVGYAAMTSWLYAKGKNIYAAPLYYHSLKWQKTKVFFSFDKKLEQEIRNSNIDATMNVPAILLNQCPFSCFFVQTNENFVNYNYDNLIDGNPDTPGVGLGFFVTISQAMKHDDETLKFIPTGKKIMDITFCAESESNALNTLTVSMEIPCNNQEMSIKESIIFSQNYDETVDDKEKIDLYKKNDLEMLIKALQYILHLCSKNSEITPKMPIKRSFMTKRQKANAKVKRYEISLKPSERNFPIHNNVYHGENHTGETKKAHIRRAHWAFRWCGHKSERHLEIRWIKECIIHPEMINAGNILNVRK